MPRSEIRIYYFLWLQRVNLTQLWKMAACFIVMNITLPLAEMTTAEKLDVMEVLWHDLSFDESNVPSPDWHDEILQKREALRQSGAEQPIDWETAKKELRSRLK